MSEIKIVLFDLDGTLIDTAKDFIRIIRLMCEQYQRPVPDDEQIRAQVSAGARAMVGLVFPELDQTTAVFSNYRQQFLDLYQQNIVVDTDLFQGMMPILERLESQGIAWGIVTNKPRYLSELLLTELDLHHRCQVLVCPEDVKETKPNPEPLLLAANQLIIPPQQAIYVGDHPRDIDAGRAAEMVTILAAYGYLPPESKDDLAAWQADYIVMNVTQLSELLSKLLD